MKITLPLDFHTTAFCGEARKNLGEDNWAYSFYGDAAIIAVFDGCGGSGARKHDDYNNHSEAFMASRLCAGALYECVQQIFPTGQDPTQYAEHILGPCIESVLKANLPEEKTNGITIKGMRTLPSTMAAALIQAEDNGALGVSPIWAGDSRVYILDATGLSQLSVDDSNQPDPMEGLYDDGTLTNVICADKPIHLNCSTYRITPPFMVITATDGCFGYVSSPMEFEGMILHTMLESSNVAAWEDNLQKLIASYAGDDHTLCLASFGYGSFASIQQAFQTRYNYLRENYLETVWATPWEDRDTRRTLWKSYRRNYMKYIEGGKR